MKDRPWGEHGYHWHGYQPSADRFVPPESLPEPTEGVHWTTEKAPAVWADLTFPDGVRTVKGFAMAWVREDAASREDRLVQVQWIEHSRARSAWVRPDVIRRRQLQNPHPHRDG